MNDQVTRECGVCEGSGKIGWLIVFRRKCEKCNGQGFIVIPRPARQARPAHEAHRSAFQDHVYSQLQYTTTPDYDPTPTRSNNSCSSSRDNDSESTSSSSPDYNSPSDSGSSGGGPSGCD
jgi:hypothetical protein